MLMTKESVTVAPSGGKPKAIGTAEPMHDMVSIRNSNVPMDMFRRLVFSRLEAAEDRANAMRSLATLDFYRNFRQWMVPMVKCAIGRTSGESTGSAIIEIANLTGNGRFGQDHADLLRETIATLRDGEVVDLIRSFNEFLSKSEPRNPEVLFLAFRIGHFNIDSD